MSYEFKWEDDGYYLRMWGTVTTDDMNNALEEIWTNPKSDGMRYCIRDYLDVTKVGIDMDWDEVALYVSTYEKHTTENCRHPLELVAFLSGNKDMDKIIEGYSQVMKEHSPSSEFKNFNNIEDARAWISLSL